MKRTKFCYSGSAVIIAMKAYRISRSKGAPVICHIPHASVRIPRQYKKDFLLSKQELDAEARSMADLYADELFSGLAASFGSIVATVSRLVVDMERFENDDEEAAAKCGMGVLYSRTQEGYPLRMLYAPERMQYLRELYRPYHKAFEEAVDACLVEHDVCLILDCHTFPSAPRGFEVDQRTPRPDICIGVDDHHTPGRLKRAVMCEFAHHGYSVKRNSPYSGSIVPLKHYRDDGRVLSIMIEVNRALYMDERTFKRKKGFERLASRLCDILEKGIQRSIEP